MAPRHPRTDAPSGPGAAADRVPSKKPEFTVGDLRRAIPKHCFERDLATSFKYLAVDLAVVAALFLAANRIDSLVTEDGLFGASAPYARALVWVAYWIVQGCVMTGLWVIGHECGHGGFADSEVVGDAVGAVVHSALLVPYWSWKISHRRHHSNTGNMDRDEVFVPKEEDEFDDNPLLWSLPGRALQIFVTMTVGWFLYLGFNITSHKNPGHRWVNHFWPWSPIFSAKERFFIVLSDVFLGVTLYGLYQVGLAYGFVWLTKMYIVPYFFVNFWLVLITLLQHTDTSLPHYTGSEWDWLRGALATVDRDFGVLNVVMHHIMDTHVAHHLFSTMPHYHAQEATEAIKPILGDYYRMDRTPVASALWTAYAECNFVREEVKDSGVLWFYPAAAKAAKNKKA